MNSYGLTMHGAFECYRLRTMLSPAWMVLARSAMIAQKTGSSEIELDDLILALGAEADISPKSSSPAESLDQHLLPIPKWEIPLSAEASAALCDAGDLENLSVEQLKVVLLRPRSQPKISPSVESILAKSRNKESSNLRRIGYLSLLS